MKYSKDEGQSEILLAQAISQIRHKHYPERYLHGHRRCLLLAVAVSGKEVSYAFEPKA